jgi:hypothetical protein
MGALYLGPSNFVVVGHGSKGRRNGVFIHGDLRKEGHVLVNLLPSTAKVP